MGIVDERFFTDSKGERATGCNCEDKSASWKDLMPIAAKEAVEAFLIVMNDAIIYASRLGIAPGCVNLIGEHASIMMALSCLLK
jgi:hypothetical protein